MTRGVDLKSMTDADLDAVEQAISTSTLLAPRTRRLLGGQHRCLRKLCYQLGVTDSPPVHPNRRDRTPAQRADGVPQPLIRPVIAHYLATIAATLRWTETIGLIIPDNSNPFFSSLARAVEDAAAELGYALLLTNSDGNLAKERRNLRNIAARQVDGIVLSSVLFEPDLAELEFDDIPAVLLDHDADTPGFNSVGVDRVAAAKSAVEHLIGHGHTNIALAMGINTGNTWTDASRVGCRP